jgi:hypothetical protein
MASLAARLGMEPASYSRPCRAAPPRGEAPEEVMSPSKRASSVDGLRRGAAPAPAHAAPENHRPPVDLPAAKPERTQPVKPARITLNLPPELYRQLQQWTTMAAEAIDVPRVSQQDALRVMIRVITSGETRNAEQHILGALREELAS